MSFSKRVGLEPEEPIFQKGSINTELKNSLWNILEPLYSNFINSALGRYNAIWFSIGRELFTSYWKKFFKLPVDEMPRSPYDSIKFVRNWFFYEAQWNKIYEYLEFTAKFLQAYPEIARDFKDACNNILERENSAYRFVGEDIIEIISKEEIKVIESSMVLEAPYSAASIHIEAAVKKLSDRNNPDYRNSIKESISAVEATAKLILNMHAATLSEVLKSKQFNLLHPALKEGLNKIYGYTSDSNGIRHALIDDEQNITADDAIFMLVMCSAFVNYLIAKSKK